MRTPLEFPLLLYCHAQDLVFVVVTGLTLSIFPLLLLLCRVNNEILGSVRWTPKALSLDPAH